RSAFMSPRTRIDLSLFYLKQRNRLRRADVWGFEHAPETAALLSRAPHFRDSTMLRALRLQAVVSQHPPAIRVVEPSFSPRQVSAEHRGPRGNRKTAVGAI